MASAQNIKIDLLKRFDRNNEPFYLGSLQSPATISFKKGIVFYAWTSIEEQEALDIGCAAPGSICHEVKKILDKNNEVEGYYIPLEERIDRDGEVYYVSTIQADLEINLETGYVFFLWTTPGSPSLQIKKNKFIATNFRKESTQIINRRPGSNPDFREAV